MLVDSLSRSFPSSILEMETEDLKKVIDGSSSHFVLDYASLPIQKYHRSHLSYNLGTGIGRAILQDYLDVCCLDNIDFYYESYLKSKDYRVDPLNKMVIKKIEDGDGPDVLCLNLDGSLCLGEFKGRIDSKISNKSYNKWKKQFTVVSLSATDGRNISDVNHICALSARTNRRKSKTHSMLHIVDPPGGEGEVVIKTTAQDILLKHYHHALKALGYFDLAERLNKEEANADTMLPEPTEGKITLKGIEGNFIVPYSESDYLQAVKVLKP